MVGHDCVGNKLLYFAFIKFQFFDEKFRNAGNVKERQSLKSAKSQEVD